MCYRRCFDKNTDEYWEESEPDDPTRMPLPPDARQLISDAEVEALLDADAEAALQDRLTEQVVAWCEANPHTSGADEAQARHDAAEAEDYLDDLQSEVESHQHAADVHAWRASLDVEGSCPDQDNAHLPADVSARHFVLVDALEAIDLELVVAHVSLDAAIEAPVPNNVDPTLWLPDELLVLVLQLVFRPSACVNVCRRWRALCGDPRMRIHLQWDDWSTHGVPMIVTSGAVPSHRRVLSLAVHHSTLTSGATLYSGASDGTIDVWFSRGGPCTHAQTLHRHAGPVTALAVSKGGMLFSGGEDGTVRVMRTCLRTLRGHSDSITTLWMGSDNVLFSGSRDSTVVGWCALTHHQLHVFRGHTDAVHAIVGDSHGKLFTGSFDTTVRVWSSDGEHLWTCRGHTDRVCALAMSSNEKVVYSSGRDEVVRAWSTADGSLLRTWSIAHPPFAEPPEWSTPSFRSPWRAALSDHTGFFHLAVFEDQVYATVPFGRSIAVHRSVVREKEYTLRGMADYITAMVVGPDGTLYLAFRDCQFVHWMGQRFWPSQHATFEMVMARIKASLWGLP